MTFSDAEYIAGICGVGSILHLGSADTRLVRNLLQLGANAIGAGEAGQVQQAHDSVVVEAGWFLQQPSLPESFLGLRRLTSRWLIVRFADNAGTFRRSGGLSERAAWENAAIGAGYRRAPCSVTVQRYQSEYNDPLVPDFLEFEKLPDEAWERWPLDWLLKDRDLHMDMSRESGSRADAHMVRYALAAQYVRPGDTVLDCACGLGYGSAILAAQSRGSHFIGVDLDEDTVAYAQANFSGQYGIRYQAGSATDLSFIADDSIDLLVSFETIEHLQDYSLFLKEAFRVLRPDGRIISSVPDLWVDETGKDPNPYHFHAFDHAKFHDTIAEHFLVERRWTQTAPGGFKLWDAPRMLQQLPLAAPAQESEWLILLASVDPLKKPSGANYFHPEFGDAAAAALPGWLVAFGDHYDNPWLYRTLVQMGERFHDKSLLIDLAARVLGEAQMDSADFGAALSVLAYALLEQGDAGLIDDALNLIQAYREVDSRNPHVARWKISATFAGAKLLLAKGERQAAAHYFSDVAGMDFTVFSPLIATKTIASCFMLGTMRLADGDAAGAAASFAAGVHAGRKALHADDLNAIGNVENPLAFGFKELAEVADMAGQCATALRWLPHFQRSPGLFWKTVDCKRFGLASWALALEQENSSLRKRLVA